MNAANDADYAQVFGLTFTLLAQNPSVANKSVALLVWTKLLRTGFDVSMMDVDPDLLRLGVAMEEEDDDGSVRVLYRMSDGSWE